MIPVPRPWMATVVRQERAKRKKFFVLGDRYHPRTPPLPDPLLTRSRGGAGHGTLRWTRASEQAGKALRSQGHQCAHVM